MRCHSTPAIVILAAVGPGGPGRPRSRQHRPEGASPPRRPTRTALVDVGRRYNLPRFLTPRTSEPGAARRTPRKANVLGPSPGGYENSSIDDKGLAVRNLPCMWKPHKLPALRMRSWYSTSTPRPEFEMPSRDVTKTYPFEKL